MFRAGKVLLGSSNFREISETNAFFIDKSMFIKKFIENEVEVPLILRPRRFGKSTNMSMLKAFLSRGADRENFRHYEIYKHSDFVDKHCGKYYVIYINLKECDGQSFAEMKEDIWDRVIDMYKDAYRRTPGLDPEFNPKNAGWQKLPAPFKLENYLKMLTDLIHEMNLAENSNLMEENRQFNRVVVLIDEYENPLNRAAKNGYFSEAEEFFERFYSNAFKHNEALFKACLMGIVEISGKGILSGLKNVCTCSINTELFSEYFGFTEDEIRPYAEDILRDVIDWYNGYNIGSKKMINPWSFSNWLMSRETGSYWANTGNLYAFLSTRKLPEEVIEELTLLSTNRFAKIPIEKLSTKVNIENSNCSRDSILHFFIHAGYLNYDVIGDRCYASIPNKELQVHWQQIIGQLFLGEGYYLNLCSLRNALKEFYLVEIRKHLKSIMSLSPSVHQTSENSVHIHLLGTLCALSDGKTVEIVSIQESSSGRFIVAVKFFKDKRVVLFELKRSNKKIDLQADAKMALDQIVEKKYFTRFKGYSCLLIGVTFNGKYVSPLESIIEGIPLL